MPEEQQDEAVAPSRPGRRKVNPAVVIGAVFVLALGAVGAVFLIGGKPATKYVSEGEKQVHPQDWLDIPLLTIKDIPLSVPSGGSAVTKRKTITVGVTVRFAPPEGEKVDIKALQKTFVPRMASLGDGEFRHIIIEQMSSKDYGKLCNTEVRNQLLKTFKQSFNEKLKQYDLQKMARVHDVMWHGFFWQ